MVILWGFASVKGCWEYLGSLRKVKGCHPSMKHTWLWTKSQDHCEMVIRKTLMEHFPRKLPGNEELFVDIEMNFDLNYLGLLSVCFAIKDESLLWIDGHTFIYQQSWRASVSSWALKPLKEKGNGEGSCQSRRAELSALAVHCITQRNRVSF